MSTQWDALRSALNGLSFCYGVPESVLARVALGVGVRELKASLDKNPTGADGLRECVGCDGRGSTGVDNIRCSACKGDGVVKGDSLDAVMSPRTANLEGGSG